MMINPHTIVIASESFYPVISGVAVMTDRLAHYLASQGHKVVVITPSRNYRMYKEQRRGYTIQRIPSWPNPLRKVQRITFFPNRVVKQILKKLQPDIVHVHDPWVTSIAVARYCRKNEIPVVVTHHFSYDFLRAYVRKLKPLHKSMQIALEKTLFLPLYNSCEVLTVPTETMRKVIAEIENLEVVPRVVSNGVEVARFSTQIDTGTFFEKYHIPTDRPLVTCVSRLDPEKNMTLHLRALSELRQKKVRFHAVIVGDGTESEELQKLAAELRLSAHITWIKRIDNQSTQLVQLYQAATVFCIPSPIETESIVTMEAMASGVPVVAAKRRALRELVVHDVTGYLLPENDVVKWAEHIQKLLQEPELAKSMGQAAQAKIMVRDLSLTLPKFEEIYEELLFKGATDS